MDLGRGDTNIYLMITPIPFVQLKTGVLLVKEIFFMICEFPSLSLIGEMFISRDLVKADMLKAKGMFDELMFVKVRVGCG